MDYSNINSSKGINIKKTSAGQIAIKLDALDGNSDKKISKSVWNEFAESHGGRAITEDFISIERAWNLITKYAINESNKQSKNIEVLAQEWIKELNNNQATTKNNANNTKATNTKKSNTSTTNNKTNTGNNTNAETPKATKNEKTVVNQQQVAADEKEIKVTIPKMYASPDVKAVVKNQTSGKALTENLKKGIVKNLTPENVAYAFTNDVNFGPNTKSQAECIFDLLVYRLYDLDLFQEGKDYGSWTSVCKDLSYIKQNQLLHEYRNRIVTKENKILKADNEKRNFHNKNLEKIQEKFDKSNHCLAEAANMDKSKLKFEDNNSRVKLPDGKWISIERNTNGEICAVSICVENNPQDQFASVCYSEDKASYKLYELESQDCDMKHSITSGFNFEKIKALAEKIFGMYDK